MHTSQDARIKIALHNVTYRAEQGQKDLLLTHRGEQSPSQSSLTASQSPHRLAADGPVSMNMALC